jgi:EAL domain-containing protein (putative c-di-GMP-specific phosphodiesterase class I)
LGFSFALSGGRNLDQVLKTVAAGQFSLITLPHQTILANSFERAGSVAAKLRAAGARDHIEIAATGIELEETAIELIDCDVMLAQGKLFSDARPLRGKSPSGSGAHSAR